jgi:gamma-glutamylcyclotransferase (GGCT)/AIG2-like uncharacterized protein YtfP
MDRRNDVFILSRRPSDESPERFLVFVYGSLMKGYRNHRLLEAGNARYLGRAATSPRYTLVDLMVFPGLLEVGRTRVRGEVYEVDVPTLANLDRLEGHPRFYRRQHVSLAQSSRQLRREHHRAKVWAYFLSVEEYGQRPEIPSGDWRIREPIKQARNMGSE